MTIDEFLILLAAKAHEVTWVLQGKGERRLRVWYPATWKKAQDPLAFMAETEMCITYLTEASEKLGLSYNDAYNILFAAAGLFDYDPVLRRQLLEAVGLEE